MRKRKNLTDKELGELAKQNLKTLEHKSTEQQRLSLHLKSNPDFIEKVQVFKQELKAYYKPSQLWSGYDLYFLKDMGVKVLGEHIKTLESIAKKYSISTQTLITIMNGYYDNPDMPLDLTYHQVNTKDGKIVIKLSPDITETEYRAIWHKIEAAKYTLGKHKERRYRGPDDFQLLYCTHQAILRGDNFEKISENFNRNKLKGYSRTGNEKKFIYTPKELEKYYNKYLTLLS